MNPMLLKDCSTLRKLMLMKAVAGGASGSECIATGNPAFFAANTTKNMYISVPSAQNGTPAKIWVTGTNIWDEQWLQGKNIDTDGSYINMNNRIASKNYIRVIPGETYVMLWKKGGSTGRCAYYDENFDLVEYKSSFPDNSANTETRNFGTFTVPAGAVWLRFGIAAATYENNISLNYPPTDLDYHASAGTSEYDVILPTTEVPSINGNNVVTCSVSGDMNIEFTCNNPKKSKLVVMTYNIQAFKNLSSDKEMQQEIVEEYAPSIIGFQEIGIRYFPDKIKEFFTSDYWAIFSGTQPAKTAIASKYGLSNVEYHDFTTNGSEIKGYQTAEFKFKGKTIFLVNTHTIMSSSAAVNEAQCLELLSLVSTKEYFIIVGDLNTDINNVSGSQYTTCIKPFIDAGYNLANCKDSFIGTWTSGKTTEGTWYCTDNIITSANLSISNVRRDTIKIREAGIQDKAIDHVALICDIDLA